MAYSKLLFNTQTLAILNILDPGESLDYDWSIDEDYSIVLIEGSIVIGENTLTGISEYRVQPNEQLSVTGAGDIRNCFISLFRVDKDSTMDQLVSEESKIRMRTFSPTWFDDIWPDTPPSSWKSDFSSGNYTFTKVNIEEQIANSGWN